MSTLGKKEARINFKINPALREEFQAAAHLRGASMSSLLHQYIVKIVREEKDQNLEEFNRALEDLRRVVVPEDTESGDGPIRPASTITQHPRYAEQREDEEFDVSSPPAKRQA